MFTNFTVLLSHIVSYLGKALYQPLQPQMYEHTSCLCTYFDPVSPPHQKHFRNYLGKSLKMSSEEDTPCPSLFHFEREGDLIAQIQVLKNIRFQNLQFYRNNFSPLQVF